MQHVPEVACNEFGTPLFDDVLAQAERRAEFDIALLRQRRHHPDERLRGGRFGETRRSLARFLLAGRRWNYGLTEPLEFAPDWEAARCGARCRRRANCSWPGAIDYFCFPRGLWGDIPPFAIGRTVWDNWLLWRARARGAALVDATTSVLAVHQNHHYGHLAGGRGGAFHGPEAQRNVALTGGEHHHYTLNVATHR